MKEKLKHMRGFYGVSISPAVCILRNIIHAVIVFGV